MEFTGISSDFMGYMNSGFKTNDGYRWLFPANDQQMHDGFPYVC